MDESNPDLENFLQKVDKIDDLIKDLATSSESSDHSDAIRNADDYLKKFEDDQLSNKETQEKFKKKTKHAPRDHTGVDRTVINQRAFDDDDPSVGPDLQPNMNQEAFMSVLERDAKDRAARKKRLKQEATEIKDRGNEEFKNSNYEKAVELYTEALSRMKDYEALWTNRAQCYIKLAQYDKAISDCDWALRVSDRCLKAYIHKGKALASLAQFDEALECFRQALQVEPAKEKAISEYIRDVELKKKSSEEEKLAKECFDAGDLEAKGLIGIMEKLNKLDNLPYYYSGGLRLVKQVMKDTKEKTLFRTSGGLEMTEKHPYISKCMKASPRSLSQDEVDMCAATLEVFVTACTDNEENQHCILDCDHLPDEILRFFDSKWKATRLVKTAALDMLHIMSENEHSRNKIVSRFDTARLMSSVFTLMRSKHQKLATKAIGLLNNLALNQKFKIQLREKIDDVLPGFESVMNDEETTLAVLPCCISTVTNLCGDPAIRLKLRQRSETWKACSTSLARHCSRYNQPEHEEIMFSLLGLLMNLTLETSDSLKALGPGLCERCVGLLDCGVLRLEERSCGVLAHILTHSGASVDVVCRDGGVPRLLHILQNVENPHLKPAMKALTVCTQDNTQARESILKHEKGLKRVYDLLKHPDEQLLGNASLCLSHCATLPTVCAALAKTNVLMDLLVLARDGNDTQVRHNCAILIAKLAQGHPRHLERLRELDGLGILHDVMQHVKE